MKRNRATGTEQQVGGQQCRDGPSPGLASRPRSRYATAVESNSAPITIADQQTGLPALAEFPPVVADATRVAVPMRINSPGRGRR